MSDPIAVSSAPKSRRWLKVLLGLIAVLAALVVVAYFWLTSAAFFRGAILPRVGRALNANVTVGDAAIHPFSQVTLRDFKVQAAGQEPLVSAPEVNVRYHLRDILRGNIRVDEIALVSPVVAVVENPDGSRNFDPILKALQTQPSTATPAAKSSKPLQLDLGKLTLSNAEFRQIKNYAGGQRDVLAVTNLNLTLANLKNGQTAKFELSAGVRVEKNPPAGPVMSRRT